MSTPIITNVISTGFLIAAGGGFRFIPCEIDLDQVDAWEIGEQGEIIAFQHMPYAEPISISISAADIEAAMEAEQNQVYVAPVPRSVKAWRFRATAELHGLTAAIETVLQALDEPLRTVALAAWHGDSEFERQSPTLLALADQLEITASELDDLFREAAALTL